MGTSLSRERDDIGVETVVNPVGLGPQQAVVQPSNTAQAQDIRQRNEQTQPRQAPPATTQENTLQTRSDDQRRQNGQLPSKPRPSGTQSSETNDSSTRGHLLDISA